MWIAHTSSVCIYLGTIESYQNVMGKVKEQNYQVTYGVS